MPENDTELTRPPALDYVVADFGKNIGLEGLVFDGNHQIVLEVDGIDLVLEYAGDGGLLLQAVIDSALEELPSDFHLTLNLLNAQSFRVGGGIVMAMSAEVMWMDRLPVSGLTVEALDEAVTLSASRISAWKEMLQSILSDESPSDSYSVDINTLIPV